MSNLILGTDGISPIFQPSGRFSIWALEEIFTGGQGQGKYIPKVNDRVIDLDSEQEYKVVSIDQTTFISSLVKVVPSNVDNFTDTDMLLGVGPGTASDTYRVYIDKSVTPYILAVDARLKVAGSMVNKAMIFKGSELNNTAVVISALYDQTGTLLGQAIPLELAAIDGFNTSIKIIPTCHTLADLTDGEIVTAVFYSDIGNVVSKRQLLVENTSFIRNTDASVKYITSITLESPFLSKSDISLIQYPINVPLAGMSFIGVVHYSDGAISRMPIDGTKFSLFGFEGFISTVVGQKFNLVLKYALSPGEVAYGSQSIGGQFITAIYKATTMKVNGAFSVKLLGFPVYINAVEGYRLEWFLYTLDRIMMYRVTPYVHFNPNGQAFNPLAYGIAQHLDVSINMSDVNGSFTAYRHVQSLDLTLIAPASDRVTPWTVGFSPGQYPQFGINNHAEISATYMLNQATWGVKILPGVTTLQEWLDRLYYSTIPLLDTIREISAPAPTHFALLINNNPIEFPISAWNNELAISSDLPDNTTLFVKFIKKTVTNTLELSASGVTVWHL